MFKNLYLLWIVGILLLSGCAPKEEKPAIKAMDQDLPLVHQKAAHDKEMLLLAKACFQKAQNVKEANLCVKAVEAETDAFVLGTYKVWDKAMQTYTYENIDANIAFESCLIKTESFSDLLKCRKPLSVKPLLNQ